MYACLLKNADANATRTEYLCVSHSEKTLLLRPGTVWGCLHKHQLEDVGSKRPTISKYRLRLENIVEVSVVNSAMVVQTRYVGPLCTLIAGKDTNGLTDRESFQEDCAWTSPTTGCGGRTGPLSNRLTPASPSSHPIRVLVALLAL